MREDDGAERHIRHIRDVDPLRICEVEFGAQRYPDVLADVHAEPSAKKVIPGPDDELPNAEKPYLCQRQAPVPGVGARAFATLARIPPDPLHQFAHSPTSARAHPWRRSAL